MRKYNQTGFTLIEVILVLAIGGLIFLLAFLAFAQVSRNRRDTQRRADASRIISELENWAADHNGSYPTSSEADTSLCTPPSTAGTTFKDFMVAYMCPMNAPTGSPYNAALSTSPGMTTATGLDRIMYTTGHSCAGSAAGNVRVQIRIESGIVCRDNR